MSEIKTDFKTEIKTEFQKLQDAICSDLEEIDGLSTFQQDAWQREEGGGGKTRIIQNGQVFEKGGVNFSAVHGPLDKGIQKHLGVESGHFFATGVSIVLHPENPWVPIIHMNVRYFQLDDPNSGEVMSWFGGGIDLTPIYINKNEARGFHSVLKSVCDKHNKEYYQEFKKWADDYFYIPHRKETRGVGGIFFDRLSQNKEKTKDFVMDVGYAFIPSYKQIVLANKAREYTEENKKWQSIRRGRYVEFNLVYDRGTKFGLDSGGRIESILMSLPKYASWEYNHKPEEHSLEYQTLQNLKRDIDWIGN